MACRYATTVGRASREDSLIVVKRALFAWLIADGDMHLKNMALLKIADPGDRQFRSVRMSPLYDAVTTRVFPQLKHDRLALKLNGKDDKLRRADFRALATIAGLRASDAENSMDQMLQSIRRSINSIALPENIGTSVGGQKITKEVLDICRARMEALEK